MIIFIDEGDAFFRKRDEKMSENLRNSINAFLYRSGTPSKKVIL
jgi:ATPase family AAA domain-containing protein 3A/B